jgi:hypothetical protein
VSEPTTRADLPINFELPPDLNVFPTGKPPETQPPFDYSGSRNTSPMPPKPTESAVDRLIALASDEPPSKSANGQVNLESVAMVPDPGPEQAQMLNSLMQVRSVLPFISRLVEVGQTAATTTELSRSMGELAVNQRDLRNMVQDHTSQMKRLEDEVTRAREAAERTASDATDVMEDMRGVQSTVRKAALAIGVLLAALIGLVLWLLIHGPIH